MQGLRTSGYLAVSLDGYIARSNGDVDWLPVGGSVADGDFGYAAFMATVDWIVMGRATFEKVLSFEPWPYVGKRVLVLSSGTLEIPPALRASVALGAGEPAAILRELAELGARHIYVDGGKTLQRFIAAGQLDRLILTTIPILLGSGIPLFAVTEQEHQLQHQRTHVFECGLVQSDYAFASAS